MATLMGLRVGMGHEWASGRAPGHSTGKGQPVTQWGHLQRAFGDDGLEHRAPFLGGVETSSAAPIHTVPPARQEAGRCRRKRPTPRDSPDQAHLQPSPSCGHTLTFLQSREPSRHTRLGVQMSFKQLLTFTTTVMTKPNDDFVLYYTLYMLWFPKEKFFS